MKHLKRQSIPKSWPVHRKGSTFVVKPNSNVEKGIPMLVVLRDLMKIAQNRKEVKNALHNKNILLNGKFVKEDKNSAMLFDVISDVPAKKNYKITMNENGKFRAEEIKESEAGMKISKIINKKSLKNKKVQLNLYDGRNFVSDLKCNVGDSVVVNFKNKKAEKCLPLQEKASVIVFAGKHAGRTGEIEKINLERRMASVKSPGSDGTKINVLLKQLMVI